MVDFKNFDSIAKPKSLSDIAFKSEADFQLLARITSDSFGFPNSSKYGFVLHGDIGAGKTTLAEMLPDLLDRTNHGMNDAFRETYDIYKGQNGVEFLSSLAQKNNSNFGGLRTYYVLNEVDNLTPDASQQLKCLMDKLRDQAIFILTTNHFHVIDKPIIDRSYCFSFSNVPSASWHRSMRRILNEYMISNASDAFLDALIARGGRSGRSIYDQLKLVIEEYYAKNPVELAKHVTNRVPAFV